MAEMIDPPSGIFTGKVKAASRSDVVPQEIRAVAAPRINPVAFIELTGDVAGLAGTTVTSDTTASGGGVDALLEGVAWNAGATLAASATNLAAALQAALQVHNINWTATATGAVVTATLVGAFATGDNDTIASDAPNSYVLQRAPLSELENFSLWQIGDGYGDENAIPMGGNDLLYLFIYGKLTAASNTTQILIRLLFRSEGPDESFYREIAQDLQPAAGGILPVDLPEVQYRVAVAAGRTYRHILAIPVDIKNVRVAVRATGLPDADDELGIQIIRTMREGSTTVQ